MTLVLEFSICVWFSHKSEQFQKKYWGGKNWVNVYNIIDILFQLLRISGRTIDFVIYED